MRDWLSCLRNHICQAWIRRVKDAALDLSNAGKIIDEEDIAYKLLSGLPEQYRPLRTALMALRSDVQPLTITRVSAAILMEERSIPIMQAVPTPSPSTLGLQHAHTTAYQPQNNTREPERGRQDSRDRRYRDYRDYSPRDRDSRYRDRDSYYRDNRRDDRNRGSRYSRRYSRPRDLCNFCKNRNHVEESCYLKYPEKHL